MISRISLLCLGLWLCGAQAGAPVPVTVYYESLCPDSIKFYTNQLYPAMQMANLSTNVDLTLVPFGKSMQEKAPNGSWVFSCHHGERECYGNKVHACALKIVASKNQRLQYIDCLMKTMLNNKDAIFPAEKCAEHIVDEKDAIISCANGTMGDDQLAMMGNKTMMFQAKLTSVPTIVFNSAFNQKDQDQAQSNFKGVLCKYISAPKPAECAGTSGASTFTSASGLMSVLCIVLSLFLTH